MWIFTQYKSELQAILRFDLPRGPAGIFVLGLMVTLALLMLTPALNDFQSKRYFLPLLSFIPFFLASFFRWLDQKNPRYLRGTLCAAFVFFLWHQQLFLTQNRLLSLQPTADEIAFNDSIRFLKDHGYHCAVGDYWLCHKLTYLSASSLTAIPFGQFTRDLIYEGSILNTLAGSGLAAKKIVYLFDTKNALYHQWKRQYSPEELHHAGHQQFGDIDLVWNVPRKVLSFKHAI